jgi:hypothetical protein
MPHGATGARFVFGLRRNRGVRSSWGELASWLVGEADGTDGVDGRAMPGPRSWMAFIGADTQSGQINFTARRNNVIGWCST